MEKSCAAHIVRPQCSRWIASKVCTVRDYDLGRHVSLNQSVNFATLYRKGLPDEEVYSEESQPLACLEEMGLAEEKEMGTSTDD